MCGHGTIGTVTTMIERGLVTPATPGRLNLDTPAGPVVAEYEQKGPLSSGCASPTCRPTCTAAASRQSVDGIGRLEVDVAYGGNFYAIVDPQESFAGLERHPAEPSAAMEPAGAQGVRREYVFLHPEKPEIAGLSHVMWTGKPRSPRATARNAVFYGDKAIDRSPCGTGTCARMAQWAALGKLREGQDFVHESIIGSEFVGRIAGRTKVADKPAIVPTIQGWARVTGFNTIFVDDRDPYWKGFQVADKVT